MFEKELDLAKKIFINHISALAISPKSHKNYRSDLNHFTGWLILKIRSFGSYAEDLTDAIPFLNKAIAEEYRSYLVENNIPSKTINRRLSSLRHLAKALVGSRHLDFDFMEGIENLGEKEKRTLLNPLVEEYRTFLEAEKVSASTIKNYTSDVRQFLAWLEKTNLANWTN